MFIEWVFGKLIKVRMKITLYYVKGEFNPVFLFTKCLSEYLGLEVTLEACKFSWSAAGSLPVLQVGNFFIATFDIIPVLSKISGIDLGLSDLGQVENKLISDLCLYKIHPNTQRAASYLSIYSSLALSTSNTIKRFLKNPLKSCLSALGINEGAKNYMKLFEEAEKNHQMLSEILDGANFFCDKFEDESRVRSSDLIVYCYLKEEIECLSKEFHVTESLNKIENLRGFLERIDSLIAPKQIMNTDVHFDMDLLEEKAIKFLYSNKSLDASEGRRKVVSIVSLTIFGYMLLNN